MVSRICVRGPTLARLATVSVLLSIGNTPALWQSCGQPSTKCPHGLVECLFISNPFLIMVFFLPSIKIESFEKYRFSRNFNFLENTEISWTWPWHYVSHSLSHLCRSSIYALPGFLWVFWKVMHQNLDDSIIFGWCVIIFRGPQSGELSYCFRIMAIVR